MLHMIFVHRWQIFGYSDFSVEINKKENEMSEEKTVFSISRQYRESAAGKLSNESFAEYESKSSELEEQAFRGQYPEFGGTVFLRFNSVEHWFEHRLSGLLEDLFEDDNRPDEPPIDLHNELQQ